MKRYLIILFSFRRAILLQYTQRTLGKLSPLSGEIEFHINANFKTIHTAELVC